MSGKKPGGFRVVNHSVPRVDGVGKVTGRAAYAGDIVLEGMAHAKVLRSPFASARIVRIDASQAARRPGVIAALTGRTLDGINPYYGHAVKDHPLLALDRVRFCGEPVAAVVAVDERTAAEALGHVAVEYEELPALLDVDAALAEGAPPIHEAVYRDGPFRGFEGHGPGGERNI